MTREIPSVEDVLVVIPASLREPLLGCFGKIARNYVEGRWEPSELNGGKFCEVVYTILSGYVSGTYPSNPRKPKNFVDACRAFEHASASAFPRSVRIQIPRILIGLYEIRNNRGVGHIGGDVDPNHMDSSAVLSMSKWVLAELVRLFHGTSCEEATIIVEGLVERVTPVVWKVNDERYRVLNRNMSLKQKTLVLLYHHSPRSVAEADLGSWLRRKNLSQYRRNVLRQLDDDDLIEFDEQQRTCILSPLGVRYIEENVNLEI